MNRKNCQNCFYHAAKDQTCNYLLYTNQQRGCVPTNTSCAAKITEAQAEKQGLKRSCDILRGWIPEDEYPKVLAERKKIYQDQQAVKEMVWQTKRKH